MFGATLFGAAGMVCVGAVVFSGGTSLILGIPLFLASWWLVRLDDRDVPDVTPAAVAALGIGVAVILWVFVALIRDTDISGRPH